MNQTNIPRSKIVIFTRLYFIHGTVNLASLETLFFCVLLQKERHIKIVKDQKIEDAERDEFRTRVIFGLDSKRANNRLRDNSV